MKLNDQIDSRIACAIILVVFVIALPLAKWTNGLSDERLDAWIAFVDSIEDDWTEFKSEHPEFQEIEMHLSTEPALMVQGELASRVNMQPLEEFFIALRLPERLRVDVVALRDDQMIGRYVWHYPKDLLGTWESYEDWSVGIVEPANITN